jgi:enoyl-[acyl-carrier protein] reductase / trans-2-enoyl-CoA reductase (NAD+)
MIVEPKSRGFICTTAHPAGCAAHVNEQIAYVQNQAPIEGGPKKVLIIGASTGYGLASRIAASFACGSETIGVFFEKEAKGKRTATAGWYNTVAFEKAASDKGLYAKSINGDAFSHEIKRQVIDLIKKDWNGGVDLVIYSLASPRRKDPDSDTVYSSCLKTMGAPFVSKSLNLTSKTVETVSIEPASDAEREETIKVMGGDDWQLWMNALQEENCLAEGVKTLAYSYIGPVLTHAIYREGTIGSAKKHLEQTAGAIDAQLKALNGEAYISVNKALVTQAAAAIPVVPLYSSILYKVMKEAGNHEGCVEQMDRLFRDKLYGSDAVKTDLLGFVRMDDWEMGDDVQLAAQQAWDAVDTDNLAQYADFAGYQHEFLKLFGFGIDNVDYTADVNIDLKIPSITEE